MDLDPNECIVMFTAVSAAIDQAISVLMRLNVEIQESLYRAQQKAPEPPEEAQGLGLTPFVFGAPGTS